MQVKSFRTIGILAVIFIIIYIQRKLNSTRFLSFKQKIIDQSARRRFCIFACSIHSSTESYSFYTPITTAAWKRVGSEAIVFFVGDFTRPNDFAARINLSRTYLKHMGAYIIDLQCPSEYAVKVSQLVRVFAGFLPQTLVDDKDGIITGDSDLLPLDSNQYQPTADTNGFIFNAFCCGTFNRRAQTYRMFPMGHIYLQKKTWRSIIIESKQREELIQNVSESLKIHLTENAPLSFDMISLYARHEFKEIYDKKMTKGDTSWYMDQILCSMLISDYRKKHANFSINERGRGQRLDRSQSISYWNRDNFRGFGDAHLIHDQILLESNWKIFNKLLNSLFNKTLVDQFNDYYRQYIILRRNSTSTTANLIFPST